MEGLLHARGPRPLFERHIKRLAWYALLADLILTTASLQVDIQSVWRWSTLLAALILVVAIWTAVADVHRHAEQERAAASSVQDRVANALSVTVGYTEFLATDTRLPDDARQQARRAMDSALLAARLVSEFRETTAAG